MIEAAGGVVWRSTGSWRVEVLVVHRPRREDWSLPKGKLRAGETALECALREVREETGLRCIAGPELPETTGPDRKGRLKRVRYWAMQERTGVFRPNAEVDEVRWMPRQGRLVAHVRGRPHRRRRPRPRRRPRLLTRSADG